jgi:predicted amidohydrolase
VTVVAVCQLALQVGAPEANLATVTSAIRSAAADGSDIVVVPELSDSGYVFADRVEAAGLAHPAATSPALAAWQELSAQLRITVVGGWCERGNDGLLYNSAAIVGPAGVLATYRKAHLWDEEKHVFTPGDGPPPVVDTPAGRIGVCICYDLEFPEWARLAALAGADLLAAPVNWPRLDRPPGERPNEVVKAQADAAVNGMWIAVADRCGTERGVEWTGGSLIVDPGGYPVAGPVLADRPTTLLADIDLTRARDKRINANNDVMGDRRPDLYRGVTDLAVPAAGIEVPG